jgi:hypothetical protein
MPRTPIRPVIASRRPFVWYSLISVAIVGCIFWVAPEPHTPQPTPTIVSPNSPRAETPEPKPRPKRATTILPDSAYYTHSDQAIIAFLDSVARLWPGSLDDSTLWNPLPPRFARKGKRLNGENYRQLKNGCKHGFISIALAKELDLYIPDFILSNDSVPIDYHPFERSNSYFAVVSYSGYKWFAKIGFFRKNELVEVHDVHPGFNFPMECYVDGHGNRVVSYPDMQSEGAGAWEFLRYYYHWEEQGLRPVLSRLDEGRDGNWTRDFWLTSTQVGSDTLAIRYSYDQMLRFDLQNDLDYLDDSIVPIIHGSTVVKYNFDTLSRRYVGDWTNSRLSYWQMLTYLCTENDHLFIQSHATLLRRLLYGKDEVKRLATQRYMCRVMDGDYPKGLGARR